MQCHYYCPGVIALLFRQSTLAFEDCTYHKTAPLSNMQRFTASDKIMFETTGFGNLEYGFQDFHNELVGPTTGI